MTMNRMRKTAAAALLETARDHFGDVNKMVGNTIITYFT